MPAPVQQQPTHQPQSRPQAPVGQPTPPANTGPDATADFYQVLNNPNRWIIKYGVPVFKSHQRKDPNTGALIKVDPAKLERIAANLQRMERDSGIPIRMTLGHTEPGKPETQQPPVAGYYRNPRVQAFGPKGEPAIVVDEWLDPQYLAQRKNFPFRSAEYYDDSEQITGVALLTRDPFLNLGVVAYQRLDCGESVTTSSKGPVLYHNGHACVPYRFLIGDSQMWPTVPGATPPPFAAVPPQYPNQPTPGYVPPPQAPVPYQNQPAPQYQQPQQPQVPAAPQNPPAQPQQPTNYAGYSSYGSSGSSMPSRSASSASSGSTARTPYRAWPGPNHRPTNLQHQHTSEGAIYGRQANYDDFGGGGGMAPPPPGPPPGAPGGGGGDMMAVLEQVEMMQEQLGQLAETVQQCMEGASQAPQEPFPPEPPGGGGSFPPGSASGSASASSGGSPPVSASRYAGYGPTPGRPRPGGSRPPLRRPPMPGRPAAPGAATPMGQRAPGDPNRPMYARYSRDGGRVSPNEPQQPQPTQGPPMRTISGLPVGYQMELDKRDREIQQLKQQMSVVFYEREQADTQACAAEISRLAAMGYAVGEYEVAELKSKPPEQRALYIQHIMTKYQRVGVDMPPPVLGDPTPGPNAGPDPNAPMTREEMQQALKLAEGDSDPNALMKAFHYIRSGGQPTMYGQPAQHNRVAGYPGVSFPDPAQVPSNGHVPNPSRNGY